jgi:hypothetical protein
MLSNTEYEITNEDEKYRVKVEYESVQGCFRQITYITVYANAAVVTCDSEGYALQVRPNSFTVYVVDLVSIRKVALEGKQKFLREINSETVSVKDNIFDKPGIEKEIISTKELPKFRWGLGGNEMIGKSTIHVKSGAQHKLVEVYYQIVNGRIGDIDSIIVKDTTEKEYVLFSADLEIVGVNAGYYLTLKKFKEAAQQGLDKFKKEIEGS